MSHSLILFFIIGIIVLITYLVYILKKQMTKETLITILAISITWYIIPGIVYLYSPKNAFLSMTVVFLFVQCILSNDFLNKYKLLNHFNLVGQKELNNSKIQDYRIWTTNLTISFSIIQLLTPIFTYWIDHFHLLTSFELWINKNYPHPIISLLCFMFIWILVYISSYLFEFLEKSIANLMKKQNNF